ncbi:MAG TPA: hypothetical protein VF893_06310 [Candidatus Bathyarchaeia archaeon]
MKMRTIKLTPKSLMEALRGKTTSVISNLPDDAELLDIKYDTFSNQVLAIVRSDHFEDISESQPIPEFHIKQGAITKNVLQPAAIAKPELNPLQKVQTKPKQDTIMLEEEFTPEQRKLLSFKMEGDFVIVKPIQYLKAEWNEINEVARSLGGRWVKGDIISYWEIPAKQT